MIELKRVVSSVVQQLYANAWLTCALLAFSAYFLADTFTSSSLVLVSAGIAGLGLGILVSKAYQSKKPEAIRWIHEKVGETEYSLHLLDKQQLNIAEQLQLERLSSRMAHIQLPNPVFNHLRLYAIIFLLAQMVHYAYPYLRRDLPPTKKSIAGPGVPVEKKQPTPPAFQSALLQIQPPAYTRLPVTRSADLNATAASGSVLSWKVRFSTPEQLLVVLANSRGEELAFKLSGASFEYHDRLLSSGLYALKAYWRRPGGKDSTVYQSEYYRLEAQPDLAPRIEPESKELYRFHSLKDKKQISLSAKISDDFRVRQAFIVATLARGSGENVKFREVRLPLGKSDFKEEKFTKLIDLKALNFTPGDELYYYWAAIDNRQPEPNFSKSDTYFIVYKDTTKLDEAGLATMAVNVMPEYFRSQRQIIIDTEKLITKRKKLPTKTFNSTSNEIGFDQKVLRLRYGQYLGEEFETSAGGGQALPGDDSSLEGFIHKHDTETDKDAPKSFAFKMIEELEKKNANEKPTLEKPAEAHGHDHGTSPKMGEEQDPLAALMEDYIHSHDDGEAFTFYEQSTRSLLKMALEQMWQSELHLRLYEPEKALPFENKALEYLKIVQQKARAFVKKTSFDPPPIKEAEKRLTGELKNVNATFSQERRYDARHLEQLAAEVLGYLEPDPSGSTTRLSPVQKRTVLQLGSLLTNQLMASGLRNWAVLSSLQGLAGGKGLSNLEIQQVKAKLYELAGPFLRSGPSYTSERKLERAFWKQLK